MSLLGNQKINVVKDMLKANIPANLMSADVKNKFVKQILQTVIQLKGNPVNMDVATKAVSKIDFKDLYGKKFPLIRENLEALKSCAIKTIVTLMEDESFMDLMKKDEETETEEKEEKTEEKETKEEEAEEKPEEKEDEDLELPEFSVKKIQDILGEQDIKKFAEYLVNMLDAIKSIQGKLDAEKLKTAEEMNKVEEIETEKEEMKENFEKRIDTIATVVAIKTLKEAKKQLIENSEISNEVKVLESVRKSMDSAYDSLIKEIAELKTEKKKLEAVNKLKEGIKNKIEKQNKETKIVEGKEKERKNVLDKIKTKLLEKVNKEKDTKNTREELVESRKKKLKEIFDKKRMDKMRQQRTPLTEDKEVEDKTLNKLDKLL